MGAGSTLLADDGDQAVIGPAVAIAVEVLDRLDLGGVRRDFDLVALLAVEVADHVVAEAVDPMVVVDGAVGIDVFGNDLILGVDEAFEAERVGSTTTGEDILYRSKRSRFVCENLRRAILGRHHLTGIRPAEQDVVAGSAIQPVSAETAGQKVFATAAR